MSSLFLTPAGAATPAGHGTFSGIVRHVSTRSISVNDVASHRTLDFLIAPTDGYGVFSPSGKTTYQMSAIHVGWHVKIDYDTNASGQRHADHVVVLR
jgi:hypothetical protein